MHVLGSAAFAALLFVPALTAQGIDPVGAVHPNAQPLANVASLAVPALDRVAIDLEDATRRQAGMPARYAIPHSVVASPATHGTWQRLDRDWSLWRLRIESPDASHVNLGFGAFALPAGARMMLYSSDYTSIVRPFDSSDHSPTGELWTPVVGTAEIVVEVYVRTVDRPQVQLDLVQVGSGYRFFGAGPNALGTDGSGTCNVDVACPQGAAWLAEIKSVAAISSGGSLFCTGFMVNNTAQDAKNYFMTANHCGITAGVAPSLVCYWNYQEPTCGGSGAALTQFNTGSTLRSAFTTSDFTLVELNTAPNPAWGVSFAGWNNAATNASSAVGIHHPSGDAKKISFEDQAVTTTSWSSNTVPGDSSHVRVIDWDTGTTEGGSSGSPLFDQNHRVIGQLHGGGAACGNNLSDWYGKFARSWTGGGTSATRLSNWLDPLNTGQMTLNTLLPSYATAVSYGAGCYGTRGSFAQTFAAGTFDLSGTAVTTYGVSLVPMTNGYTVQPGPNAWFTPVAANLGLGDDALQTVALPFSFAFPGGSTAVVRMCSNGFLWLNGASTDVDWTPTAGELAGGLARFAPLWMDLNPTTGGTCHYDVDPSGTAVYFTWNAVPAFTTGTPGAGNTCQLVLRANQSVEYRYRSVPNQPAACLVGYTRGSTLVPANIDISTAMPFSVSVDLSELGSVPVGRPVLGTTQTINVTNIPNPAGSIGLMLVGWSKVLPALNLVVIGAPDCFLHNSANVIVPFFPVLGATHPWQLVIPATSTLNGSKVFCQGALLVPPGSNAFGLITGNGVELTLGTL